MGTPRVRQRLLDKTELVNFKQLSERLERKLRDDRHPSHKSIHPFIFLSQLSSQVTGAEIRIQIIIHCHMSHHLLPGPVELSSGLAECLRSHWTGDSYCSFRRRGVSGTGGCNACKHGFCHLVNPGDTNVWPPPWVQIARSLVPWTKTPRPRIRLLMKFPTFIRRHGIV